MLEKVKQALRISTSVFDDELTGLIEAALDDLGIAGVAARENQDKPLIRRAVVTGGHRRAPQQQGKDEQRPHPGKIFVFHKLLISQMPYAFQS